jgi:hypothetical protein
MQEAQVTSKAGRTAFCAGKISTESSSAPTECAISASVARLLKICIPGLELRIASQTLRFSRGTREKRLRPFPGRGYEARAGWRAPVRCGSSTAAKRNEVDGLAGWGRKCEKRRLYLRWMLRAQVHRHRLRAATVTRECHPFTLLRSAGNLNGRRSPGHRPNSLLSYSVGHRILI